MTQGVSRTYPEILPQSFSRSKRSLDVSRLISNLGCSSMRLSPPPPLKTFDIDCWTVWIIWDTRGALWFLGTLAEVSIGPGSYRSQNHENDFWLSDAPIPLLQLHMGNYLSQVGYGVELMLEVDGRRHRLEHQSRRNMKHYIFPLQPYTKEDGTAEQKCWNRRAQH